MASTLLSTKLYIPPTRPEWVSRQKLLSYLDEGSSRKLTLLSAPAGFGKTTLLSEWASQDNSPTTWLSLDKEDNDLASFLSYVVAAVRSVEPDVGEVSQALLQSPQQPAVEAVLSALINDAAEVERRLTLVLDDYHVIDLQAIHDAVTYLLDHLPSQLRLIIATRVDPPLPLARLRASGQLSELRTDEMRFTHGETDAFLNQMMDLELSADDISALETRTEGWIVGLQLAALSMQGRDDTHDFVQSFTGSHRYVLDYLTDEVLNRQPEEVQRFLVQTSILDQMTGSLCEAVTRQNNGQETLGWLDQANLFVVPLDDERRWYRYHHLFGEMLRRRLLTIQPDQVPELHHRASTWYEQTGNCSGAVQQTPHQGSACHKSDTGGHCNDAIQHALASGDVDHASQLVEQCARQTFERSELSTIMRWADALPEDVSRNRPWLCIFYAWALRLSGGLFEAVESRLRDAEQALEKQDSLSEREARRMMGHIAAIRAYQAVYKEDIPRVMELANWAFEYLPGENFVRGLTGLALGWALRFAGDLEGADKALADAIAASLAAGNTYGAVTATCRAAYGQVLAGRLRQAVEVLKEAVQLATINERSQLPVAGYANVYLGGVYREWNELETAERYLVTGIDQCSQVGYIMDQLIGHTMLARVRQATRDWDGATKALHDADQLSRRMKGYPYARRWVEGCRVRYWLGQGDVASAARWAQDSGLSVDDELTFMRELEHIILARVFVAQGREQHDQAYLDDALHLLARLRETAEDAGWIGKNIEILALQALAFHASCETEAALQTLERALELAKPEGYVRVFIDEGQPMMDLLRIRGAKNSMTEYVSQLLAVFDGAVAATSAAASSLVESLSERELEVLRLLATGLSNPEIAEELVVAVGTVKSHTGSIYSKLDVRNRTEAVARARELNLL